MTDSLAVGRDKRASTARWLALAGNPLLHVLLLCSLPLILLLLNTGWIYNQPGFIDTWVYFGFFENYDVPQYFANEKKIMRLPWIWTGFAVYRLFPPLVANYVMHLSTLLAAPIALYFLVRKYYASWIAFFVAAALLLYVPFHGPGGWEYHDAFAALFYVLTFWFVSNAATEPNAQRWMLLAGVVWSIALHANIMYVNWTPLLAIQYVVLGGSIDWPHLRRLAITGLLAFVATTAVFWCGNYLAGRSFFFYSVFFNIISGFIVDPDKQYRWWHSWSSLWFLGRDGLPLAWIAALLVPATWFAATRWRRLADMGAKRELGARPSVIAVAFQVEFVIAAAILLIWQTQGQTSLQPWYVPEPLLYPAMLALAGQLYLVSRGRDYLGVFVLFVVPTAFIAVLGGSRALQLDQLIAGLAPAINDGNIAALAFALYLGAVVCLYARQRFAGFAAFAMLLVVADAIHIAKAPLYATVPGAPTSASRVDVYGYPAPCELRQDFFLTIVEANRFLASLKVAPGSIEVWWDETEDLGLPGVEGCHFASLFLGIPIANTGFTRVSDPMSPTVNDVKYPARIAVFSGDKARTQAIIERINALSKQAANTTWTPVDAKPIDTPVLKTVITILEPRSGASK